VILLRFVSSCPQLGVFDSICIEWVNFPKEWAQMRSASDECRANSLGYKIVWILWQNLRQNHCYFPILLVIEETWLHCSVGILWFDFEVNCKTVCFKIPHPTWTPQPWLVMNHLIPIFLDVSWLGTSILASFKFSCTWDIISTSSPSFPLTCSISPPLWRLPVHLFLSLTPAFNFQSFLLVPSTPRPYLSPKVAPINLPPVVSIPIWFCHQKPVPMLHRFILSLATSLPIPTHYTNIKCSGWFGSNVINHRSWHCVRVSMRKFTPHHQYLQHHPTVIITPSN